MTVRTAIGATMFAFLMAMLVAISAARAQEAAPPADDQATQQVIDEQISAFRSGDHALAYSYAAPNIRRIFPSVEGFISMVQGGYMPLYAPQSWRHGRSAVISGQIHREVLVTDSSGKLWQAVYTLVRQEDGSWKISGVKLEPHKGVSA